MPSDIDRLLADAKQSLRADSLALFDVRNEMALHCRNIELALKHESMADIAKFREAGGGIGKVVDEAQEDEPLIENEEVVYAVFSDVPPELAASGVMPGEILKLNRTAFDQYSKLCRQIVREATDKELEVWDERRDQEKAWERTINRLRTACALC